jgi:hypothetical protein
MMKLKWWEGNEWDLIVKVSELFEIIVDALSWKVILIGIPLFGLMVGLLMPILVRIF